MFGPISRRRWLARLAALSSALLGEAWWFRRRAEAADIPSGSPTPAPGVTTADLETQLKTGLRARRPEEFSFIHAIVLKVRNGSLPIDLVQSTFLWARRHKPYPYPYFERGLRERAAKAGYVID